MRYHHDSFIALLVLAFLLSTGCANQQHRVSTNTPIPIPSTNGLDGDEEQEILSYHNEARASVSVPPLSWSRQLAQQAATRGVTLAAQGCTLQNNQDSNYGENLFMGSLDEDHQVVIDAAESWESEKQDYSGQPLSKTNQSVAKHYTQMVWRNTTELGCAKVSCGHKLIVVCHYAPSGNHIGEKPY